MTATDAEPTGSLNPSFGVLVREARKRQKLTLEAAGKLVGMSAGHLSRLERGERSALRRDLVARMASKLGVEPARLFAAAGLLPPTVERALADPELALALVDGDRLPTRTRWMLRRRHLGIFAAGTFRPPPSGRVDIARLLHEREIAVTVDASIEGRLVVDGARSVRVVGEPLDLQRLVLAHALAHYVIDGDLRCCLDKADPSPSDADREAEATALGSFILVPTVALVIAVRDEATRYDVWAGETGALLDALAGRFGVPVWIVARRVGEEGYFVEASQMEDM